MADGLTIERLADLAGLDHLIDIALDAEDAASVAGWLESRKAWSV
ncbi:MAG: hypothetical protein R3F11_16310 [Verrucomicrobiales bacterium]